MKFIFVVIPFISLFLVGCDASYGDDDPLYFDCVHDCVKANCTKGGGYRKPEEQPLTTKLFWKCPAECSYVCMWKHVKFFSRRNAQHNQVFQYHGKWPFIRFLWMQEPASVFFSLLNLLVNMSMFRKFCHRFGPTNPMYRIWIIYGFIVNNTWIWSMIFHSRDVPFTELMDYLSASSTVYFFLYAIGMRFLLGYINFFKLLFTTCWAYFYLGHVLFITFEKFDYNYNMTANIICGATAIVSSLIWSMINYQRLPHVKYLISFVSLTAVTAILEVMDFPPYLWIFDAHSLWHLATVPLPIFLWRFVIQDCKYLMNNNNNYEKSNTL